MSITHSRKLILQKKCLIILKESARQSAYLDTNVAVYYFLEKVIELTKNNIKKIILFHFGDMILISLWEIKIYW